MALRFNKSYVLAYVLYSYILQVQSLSRPSNPSTLPNTWTSSSNYSSIDQVNFGRNDATTTLFFGSLFTPLSALTSRKKISKFFEAFPKISRVRRMLMKWSDEYLQKMYLISGRQHNTFVRTLKEEFDSSVKTLPRIIIDELDYDDDDDDDDDDYDGVETTTTKKTTTLPPRPPKKPKPGVPADPALQEILLYHNSVRSLVRPTADEMLELSWDTGLEEGARLRVIKCQYNRRTKFDNQPDFGENLWVGWNRNISKFVPKRAVVDWAKEKQYFDHRLQICLGGPCESYVQLIWHTIYKVGCSWTWCRNISVHGIYVPNAVFFACIYGPKGIKQPFLPYYKGSPCSFCAPEDKCHRKLCTNKNRDAHNIKSPWGKLLTIPQLIALIAVIVLITVTTGVTAAVCIVAKTLRAKGISTRLTRFVDRCLGRKRKKNLGKPKKFRPTKIRFEPEVNFSDESMVRNEFGKWL